MQSSYETADPDTIILSEGTVISKKDSVLLDVRNVYETRIGKFLLPSGRLQTIDPKTRKVAHANIYSIINS